MVLFFNRLLLICYRLLKKWCFPAGKPTPDHLEQCQRVLAISFKRSAPRSSEYLEYEEIRAVLNTIDRSIADGRCDYALITTLFNTGARVQEIVDIRASDLQLVQPFHVRLIGKGRKERICPLWLETVEVLRYHCAERQIDLGTKTPVFTNRNGLALTRFGVRYILCKYFDRVRATAPTMAKKRLHPHSIRHSRPFTDSSPESTYRPSASGLDARALTRPK